MASNFQLILGTRNGNWKGVPYLASVVRWMALLLLSPGSGHSPHDMPVSRERQSGGARKATLFGKPAGLEGGGLMP